VQADLPALKKPVNVSKAYIVNMRRFVALTLAFLLTGYPGGLSSAPAYGTVQGIVTIGGRPLSGVALALVDIESGSVQRVVSAEAGTFRVQVPPGRYLITTENHEGLAVGQAPQLIPVAVGQIASARVDLLALPVGLKQEQPAPAPQSTPPTEPRTPTAAPPPEGGAPVINHDAVGCFIAGEFPLLDATIEPSSTVARARVYFKSALGNAYYYVEMTQSEGKFFGKLPRPQVEASPLTYYIQATSTEFGESQTPEIEAIVVKEAKDCPADKKVAAIGPPGPVQVFSAATGAAITPTGFALGGAAIAGGLLAAIIGGAAAAGIAAAVTTNKPSPTPSPTLPSPSPTPTPTPTPSPKKSPSPIPTPPPKKSPSPCITSVGHPTC
jgi:hypothetical protein